VYWYRFSDPEGFGSRIGRTITAPAVDDAGPVRFVFVSCQNANQGAQNAYRRMIFEDERAPEADRIGFVLHLGDFIRDYMLHKSFVSCLKSAKRFDIDIASLSRVSLATARILHPFENGNAESHRELQSRF